MAHTCSISKHLYCYGNWNKYRDLTIANYMSLLRIRTCVFERMGSCYSKTRMAETIYLPNLFDVWRMMEFINWVHGYCFEELEALFWIYQTKYGDRANKIPVDINLHWVWVQNLSEFRNVFSFFSILLAFHVDSGMHQTLTNEVKAEGN